MSLSLANAQTQHAPDTNADAAAPKVATALPGRPPAVPQQPAAAPSVPCMAPSAPQTPAAQTPTVANAPAASTGDIRDIRGPIHIPYGWLWAIWAVSGLSIAGLAFAAWRWFRHGGFRRKLPYELALEKLAKARALMQPEQAYAFSSAVSEIIRNYIEVHFQARAAHRTTEEFLHDLLDERHQSLAPYRETLSDFLDHCDLAKFARWQLTMSDMEAMHQSACAFVAETGKPVAAKVKVAAPTAPAAPTATQLQPTH